MDAMARNTIHQVCAAVWSDTLNLIVIFIPHEIREGEEDWGNDLYAGFVPCPRK